MKLTEKHQAIILRKQGHAINKIATELGVAKSSVSLWVRDIELSIDQKKSLSQTPFTHEAVEKRRQSRLKNEALKRNLITSEAESEISNISMRELWLMGVMLYWAEGGKTQRMVRFSNGDPRMIKIMMRFFREVCEVPEDKFRGYIHIHSHLNVKKAESYWSDVAEIPLEKFFKTYQKASNNTGQKNTLPHGVFDVYVLDTRLFLKISGWAQGIFSVVENK